MAFSLPRLHLAEDEETVRLFISEGDNVNETDECGRTPIFFPKSDGALLALVEAGADVNIRDNNNVTAICHLTFSSKSLSILINTGADVNANPYTIHNTRRSVTALHICYDPECIKILVDAGANVNARGRYGNTPIFYRMDKKSIRALIEAGADINAVNNEGYTVKDFIVVKEVIKDMASEKITRFIRNCKWLRLHKLTKTFAFNKWYCGEEDGNGGGIGRKVDHKRIMDSNWVK